MLNVHKYIHTILYDFRIVIHNYESVRTFKAKHLLFDIFNIQDFSILFGFALILQNRCT